MANRESWPGAGIRPGGRRTIAGSGAGQRHLRTVLAGRRWLGVLVLMMVMMLVLGLSAARHLLQVLLDLAGQLIHLRG